MYDYSDMSQENIDKIFNNILSHLGLRPEDVQILEDTTSSNDMGKLTLEFLTLQQEQFKAIIKSVQQAMQKHIDFFEEDLKNDPQEFKKIQEAFESIALNINSRIDELNQNSSALFQHTQNRKTNPLNAM
jgi:methyl-accepting chemotaxis protein